MSDRTGARFLTALNLAESRLRPCPIPISRPWSFIANVASSWLRSRTTTIVLAPSYIDKRCHRYLLSALMHQPYCCLRLPKGHHARLASTSAGPYPFPTHTRPTPHQIFHLPVGASQPDIKARCTYSVFVHMLRSADARLKRLRARSGTPSGRPVRTRPLSCHSEVAIPGHHGCIRHVAREEG